MKGKKKTATKRQVWKEENKWIWCDCLWILRAMWDGLLTKKHGYVTPEAGEYGEWSPMHKAWQCATHGANYTNKMHLLFGNPFQKNSTVKCNTLNLLSNKTCKINNYFQKNLDVTSSFLKTCIIGFHKNFATEDKHTKWSEQHKQFSITIP